MPEPIEQAPRPNLPDGIRHAEQLRQGVTVGPETLPWVQKGAYEMSITKVTAEDGTEFLLGSAVDSHPRLQKAAEAMDDHQRGITDNMFYSRIAGFVDKGFSTAIETVPKESTNFPIHVMRNKGGQRVYFGVPRINIDPSTPDVKEPVVIRLGVCDKNKQGETLKVLSGASEKENRKKMSKSK